MSREQLAKLKEEFIRKRKEILSKNISVLERKLYNAIFDKFISELDATNGKILSNNKNINLTTSLDKIFKNFNENENFNVVKIFASDLTQVQALNERYFKVVSEDNKKLEKVSKDVNFIMQKRLGLNAGEVIKDGYLDRLINDNSLKLKVKEATYKAVTNGTPIKDYKNYVQTLIQGTDKISGGLQKHFNTFAYDTYAQFDRTTGKLYATKLGLNCGIYSGGRKDTTRPFCGGGKDPKSGIVFISKIGKVFTREEIDAWALLDFQGKPKNYDPASDCGGPNCEHKLDWISNNLAIKLRPELASVL